MKAYGSLNSSQLGSKTGHSGGGLNSSGRGWLIVSDRPAASSDSTGHTKRIAVLRIGAHVTQLLVILFQTGQVLSGLCKLSLFHAFTHIPVDKRTLGIHEVELVVETGPGLSNGRGVAQHAHSPLDFGQVSTRNYSGSWAPVDKLNGTPGLYICDCSVYILWDDVASVQHAARHVLSVTGITLDHLIERLEAGTGDLSHSQLLVVGLLRRDDGRVGNQREVDTWKWDQVGLELHQVHIEGAIETQGGVDRQALHQQGGEARAGSTSKAVKDQEPLKASALVRLMRQTETQELRR
ncbi:hypothetical protein FQN60_002302, partial [Etheostoma spectabile]